MSKAALSPGQQARAALERARTPAALRGAAKPAASGAAMGIEAELPAMSAANVPGTVALVDDAGRKVGIFCRPELAAQTREFLS